MKVLLLTNQVPFPPNSGYPIMVYNTINALLDKGAEVSVFSLKTKRHDPYLNDPVQNKIQFVSTTINTELNWLRFFLSIFNKKSTNATRFYQSASAAKLRNFLQHNQFDIIQIEGLFVMPYLTVIKQFSNAKVIYRAHNLEHQISELLAASERSPLKRIFFKRIARRLYRFELENLNKPDAVITVSKSDQSQLQMLGCRVITETFPVFVDPDHYIADTDKDEYPSIFHIGSLSFLPNIQSLDWFIRNVWEDVQKLDSGLQFHIAARDMPGSFYKHEGNNILLYKDVGDVHEFINSKSIMIVPLRHASGVRVRIIEAMALKKCIISTSMGAEGIDYEHGKNILIADNPNEFYKYILQCITDKKFCEKIGENARELVERRYNIRQSGSDLIRFYQSLLPAAIAE